jgi:hypothetical protein
LHRIEPIDTNGQQRAAATRWIKSALAAVVVGSVVQTQEREVKNDAGRDPEVHWERRATAHIAFPSVINFGNLVVRDSPPFSHFPVKDQS